MAISYSAGDNNSSWLGGTIINGRSSQNSYGFYIGVRETYVSGGSDNYSNIDIQIGIKNNGVRFSTNGWCFKYTVDGVVYDYQTGVNIGTNYAGFYDDVRPITIDGSNNRGMYVRNIPHTSDGSKIVHIKVEMYNSTYGSYTPGYCIAEGDFTLTKIARYAKATNTVSNIQETSVNVSWSTDAAVDTVQYRLNGGNWIAKESNVNKTSGSYTITGLTANTNYTIDFDYKRKDSGLWSYSSGNSNSVSKKTADYPKFVSVSSFVIGSNININLDNPLRRNLTINMYGDDGRNICSTTTNATGSINITPTSAQVIEQYKSIPSKQQGNYYATFTYGVARTSPTSTYRIIGTEVPIADVSAEEVEKTLINGLVPTDTTQDLTGSNKKIIKFISDVNVEVSPTLNYYSALKILYALHDGIAYPTDGNGQYLFENVENINFGGRAVDNRDLPSTDVYVQDLQLIDYINLTIDSVELYRLSETSSNLYCRGAGNYFSGNFGALNNTLEFKMRYKLSSSSTWSNWETKVMTIGNNRYTFDFQVGNDFTYTNTYDFQFQATDRCMTTGIIETRAKAGVPLMGLFETYHEAFGAKTFEKISGDVLLDSAVINQVAWTNPDMSVDFIAQSVSLSHNINNFSYYSIVYEYSPNCYFSTGKIPININTILTSTDSYGSYIREATPNLLNNEIYFDRCLIVGGGGSNGDCIPYKVILHK